jgi:Fic family protein
LAPPASEVKGLVESWVKLVNESTLPVPVTVAIAHYQFENIHPFIDGNGRVGRLLTTLLLKQHGYDLHGLSSLERYIENNLDGYYDYLAEEKRDITHFVEYFLTAITSMQNEALEKLKSGGLEQSKLFPRHQEIVEVIRDHPYCTFDFLHRRFYAIPTSTLHYDLQQLQKQKLIERV